MEQGLHQSWVSIREYGTCVGKGASIVGINQRADRMDRGLRQSWASIREPIEWIEDCVNRGHQSESMERVGGRVHQSWASIREPIEWSVWEGGAGINQRADRMERVWERVCINHRYQSESRSNGACVGESVHQSWVSIREPIEWIEDCVNRGHQS